MPRVWIEKLENEEAKKWAYEFLVKGDVLLAADREEDEHPYPCVTAEVPLADNEKAQFNIPKGVNIIMTPKDRTRSIDALGETFAMDEIKFDLECCD